MPLNPLPNNPRQIPSLHVNPRIPHPIIRSQKLERQQDITLDEIHIDEIYGGGIRG